MVCVPSRCCSRLWFGTLEKAHKHIICFKISRDTWDLSNGGEAREAGPSELFSAKGDEPAVQFPPPRTEAWIEQVCTVGEVDPYLITVCPVK